MPRKHTEQYFVTLPDQPTLHSITNQLFECLKFRHSDHIILNKAINHIAKNITINNIDTWNQYYKFFHHDFKQKVTHKYEQLTKLI